MRTLVLALLVCAPSFADIIVLQDGRFFEFDKIEQDGNDYVLKLKHGDVKIRGELVRAAYGTTGAGDLVPTTDEQKKKFAEGLRPWKGKWIKKAKWDRLVQEMLAERKRSVEQMKERRLWRNHVTVKTKQFIFKHTLPDDVFAEYQDLFETYYKFFTKYWGIRPSSNFGKATINIYHDRAYFEQVGGIGGGVVGYYMPKSRDLNFYVDRENRKFTIDVMFHEGNHMLTHMINETFWYPWWVGEGMAEYFGASEWDARTKKMRIGLLQSGRLAVLKDQFKDVDKRLKLETLLQTRGMGAIGYAWAWSFCHYLLSTPKYAKKFKKYYLALGRGKGIKRISIGMGMVTVPPDEVQRVLLKMLKVKDVEVLQKEWYDYIENALKLTRDAEADWANAGYIMSLYGERAKARKFFKRAIDGGSTDPFVFFGYAELKYAQNMPGIADKYATKALEVDPLHARAWCLRGKALRSNGDKEGGLKLIRLANELDPDDMSIWFTLTSAEDDEKKAKEKGG